MEFFWVEIIKIHFRKLFASLKRILLDGLVPAFAVQIFFSLTLLKGTYPAVDCRRLLSPKIDLNHLQIVLPLRRTPVTSTSFSHFQAQIVCVLFAWEELQLFWIKVIHKEGEFTNPNIFEFKIYNKTKERNQIDKQLKSQKMKNPHCGFGNVYASRESYGVSE